MKMQINVIRSGRSCTLRRLFSHLARRSPMGTHYGAYKLFLLTSRRSRTLDKPGFFWYNYCAGKIPVKTRVWRNWQTHQISSALPHCIYPATARQEIRAEILRACGEIGRHDGFRFHFREECRFKSCQAHQLYVTKKILCPQMALLSHLWA